ncbi:MAG: hypothetical protein NDI82_09000, partial [Anaeromyxobacteraceae bacterium]|nr:hypothetical protein [Anaeromyxobacteraceae bacterium]
MALALLTPPPPQAPASTKPARAAAAPEPAPAESVQPVGPLISSDGWVAPTARTRDVAERFFRDHALEA